MQRSQTVSKTNFLNSKVQNLRIVQMGYSQNCLGVYFERISARISLKIHHFGNFKNYFHASIQELTFVFAHLINKLVQIARAEIYFS